MRRLNALPRSKRDVIVALGDPATFWSVLATSLLTGLIVHLTRGWGWAINLVGFCLCAAIYLLVTKPDDPAQPRLITRLVRSAPRATPKR